MRAIDPQTGERKWEYKMTDVTDAGILTTASDLLFSRRPRRIFLRAGCPQRRTALEGVARRRRRVRSDDLRGERQAVRRDFSRQRVVCVRVEGVVHSSAGDF